jgi:hypothetical protein
MDFVFWIRVLIRETFIIIEVALSTTIIFSQYSHNMRLFYLFVISQTRDDLLFCIPNTNDTRVYCVRFHLYDDSAHEVLNLLHEVFSS